MFLGPVQNAPPPLDVDNDDDDVVDASDKIKRPVNRHNKHKVTVSFHAPLTLAISLHGGDKGMMLSRVRRFRRWQMAERTRLLFFQVLLVHVLHFIRHFAHKPTPFNRFDLVIYFVD